MSLKKSLLISILLFICALSNYSNDLLIPVTGDYVYYDVHTESLNGLLGIAYFNENLFRIRFSEDQNTNIIIDISHTALYVNIVEAST